MLVSLGKHDNLRKEINQIITEQIGPIAKLDKIQFTIGFTKNTFRKNYAKNFEKNSF